MNIFDCFEEGWQYTKKHGILITLLLVLVYALCNYLIIKCFPDEFLDKYMAIAASGSKNVVNDMMKLAPYFDKATVKVWLVYFLYFLILSGILNVALSLHIGEVRRINLKYISLPFGTYMKVIEYGCIMLLILMASFYLAFIPYIFFGVRLMFVMPLLLEDPDCSFSVALIKSWKMTSGKFFHYLSFYLLCILVLVIGAICLCIGAFVAYTICMFAFLALYRDAKRKLEN